MLSVEKSLLNVAVDSDGEVTLLVYGPKRRQGACTENYDLN
jgi:hypothetical protein